jgi:putative peptidoglycan lipid II flippase
VRQERKARPGALPPWSRAWDPAGGVAAWTLASRLLGFARDMLIAALLGAGPVADAFFVALKLPNLFRRLFGEGAFNAAFIPAVTRLDPQAGRRLAGELAAVMLLVLGAIVLAGEIAMPWLMRGFAPGFLATPARFHLAVTLTRITFPYLVLICLAALLSGVLNSAHRFAVAAATPVLFNVICIAALLGLRHILPTPGHALALGVAAAGIAQLTWLAIACARAGLLPVPTRPLSSAARLVLRRMVPGLLGAGVTQVNLAVGIIIASLLPPGTIAILYYADRVNQLPLGIIGASLGTTLLPALSRDHARNDPPAAALRLNRAIELALTLTIPATIALLLLAHPIIAVLFGRGTFGPQNVAASAAALQLYAAGLPFYVLARLFAPAWFARGDTTTPVLVGITAVALNLLLSLALMHPLSSLAPAAGTSMAGLLNAALSGLLLHRTKTLRPDAHLLAGLPRILAASALMALTLFVLQHPLRRLVALPGPSAWLSLTILVGAGLAVFALAAQWLGLFDLRQLRAALRPAEPTL